MQNLNQLLARLIAAEVEFVLVGGLAASVHGSSMNTRDVDVCCPLSEANLQRMERALADLHPVHRMRPDLPFVLTANFGRGLRNLYLHTDLGSVDFLGDVLGVGNFDEVYRHSIEIGIPAGRLRLLDIDTLIVAKQAMGRPHDLMTIQQLKALPRRSD